MELLTPVDPKNPDSISMRKSLEGWEERKGRKHPKLHKDLIPKGFEDVWRIFWELRQGVVSGLSGPQVSWRDLKDFTDVTGVPLSAWESETLITMSKAADEAIAEIRNRNRPPAR